MRKVVENYNRVTQGVPDLVNKAICVVCYHECGDGYGYIDAKELALPHVLPPFVQLAAGNGIC
ncbi:hypothetical protein SLEP1_g10975 [Rubroshorea leprosula]|uniref:Uncharacterized protein n=1 Tax=Rubroshorea leprosula TaxID=152421 RepID=A0AAV5IJN8_9ROSI|nr:hypothetical protein SLEP1_g10975 [Rubroshorea leprosula]